MTATTRRSHLLRLAPLGAAILCGLAGTVLLRADRARRAARREAIRAVARLVRTERHRVQSAASLAAREVSELEPRPSRLVAHILARVARHLPNAHSLVAADGSGRVLACWRNDEPPGKRSCPKLHDLPAKVLRAVRRGRRVSGYLGEAGRPRTLVTAAPILDRPDRPDRLAAIAGYVAVEYPLPLLLAPALRAGLHVHDGRCRLLPAEACREPGLAGPWRVRPGTRSRFADLVTNPWVWAVCLWALGLLLLLAWLRGLVGRKRVEPAGGTAS